MENAEVRLGGGPVFPRPMTFAGETTMGVPELQDTGAQGMTLLDFFAAVASAGCAPDSKMSANLVARRGYQIGLEMLRVRGDYLRRVDIQTRSPQVEGK